MSGDRVEECDRCGVRRGVNYSRPSHLCQACRFLVSKPIGDWTHDGLCSQADPNAWFPEEFKGRGRWHQEQVAKSICIDCPVRTQCLEWALTNHEAHGIWGGMTAQERRHLRDAS
jgi:WhiB family redox-sensing transcriptional regulator